MFDELISLGLENYEARALDSLFKERLKLRELSKKSRIPFGKVYSVIKSLKRKNLVRETNSRPKLVYVENVSDVVSRLIKEKQDKERLILENLREFSARIDKEKNKETKFFQIGIEKEERREIQLRSFKEAKNEVLQILNIYHNPGINRERKTIYEKEIEKAVARGVVFKSIYPKNLELPKILANLNKGYPKKFQVKRFDTDFVRCDIIDESKVLIKLTQEDILNTGGVLFIENERLAENLKRIFICFWEQVE